MIYCTGKNTTNFGVSFQLNTDTLSQVDEHRGQILTLGKTEEYLTEALEGQKVPVKQCQL